jgi:hypothetical protein
MCLLFSGVIKNRKRDKELGQSNQLMSGKSLLLLCMLLFSCGPLSSQQVYDDTRPRLLLGTEVGSAQPLGYLFPSVTLGPSLEVPVANHFEIQTSAMYSPDRKRITHDGHLEMVSGSVVAFAGQHLGFTTGLERSWLWTSEFDKTVLLPSAGVVLRNDFFGHGRFYVSYIFPTGCVWATSSNPCTIQSNRLQGITMRQEARSFDHMRWGLESGIYHFCNESNPNEPEVGRKCVWGPTAMVLLRFEFHCGSRGHFNPALAGSDNY